MVAFSCFSYFRVTVSVTFPGFHFIKNKFFSSTDKNLTKNTFVNNSKDKSQKDIVQSDSSKKELTFTVELFYEIHKKKSPSDLTGQNFEFYTTYIKTLSFSLKVSYNIINFFFYFLYYRSKNDVGKLDLLNKCYYHYSTTVYSKNNKARIFLDDELSKGISTYCQETTSLILHFISLDCSESNPIKFVKESVSPVAEFKDINNDPVNTFFLNLEVNPILVYVFVTNFQEFEPQLKYNNYIDNNIIELYRDLISYLHQKQHTMHESDFNTFIKDISVFSDHIFSDGFFVKVMIKLNSIHLAPTDFYHYALKFVIQKNNFVILIKYFFCFLNDFIHVYLQV